MKRNIISAFALGALALSASAQYKVVVTTTDGEKKEFETANVQSIRFEEAPEYVELTEFLFGKYTTKGDNGFYEFILGNGSTDIYGDLAEIGDIELSMVLTADCSNDYINAILPDGYYRAGTGAGKGEFNVSNSSVLIRLDEGDEGVLTTPIIDGTADVRRDGDIYDIKFELTTLQGGYIALSYKGKLNFTPGLSEYESFTEDQNITFEGAQERYFANWFYPFCDDATLELYTGNFTPEGRQIDGYWMSLSVCMPKVDDPKHPATYLPDGVYSVDPREDIVSNTQLPYTILLGKTVDFGIIYATGSHVTYVDMSGHRKQGLIKDGTITVSNNGGKIDVALVLDNGVKINGSYEGSIYVDNRNDSENAPTIEGTIDKDMELSFAPETVAMCYPLGDYIKSGIYQFMVMISDPDLKKGDYLSLELSSSEKVLPDGTYTINNEIAPFCGIKGFCDYGGQIEFSWFGNLEDLDPEDYNNIMAPIMGGTVTITTIDENSRKLVFDLVDEDNHKITGVYEDIFYDFSDEYGLPAKKAPLRSNVKTMAQPQDKAPLQPVRINR